ncbi:MAG: anthranilate synthase component I, partial [Candidatus Methanospirareceae archaeon]
MEKRTLTNSIRRVNIPFTPLEVYARIRSVFDKSFLLESVEGREKIARYSFIGFDPLLEFKSKGRDVGVNGESYKVEDPYEELSKVLYTFDCDRVGTLPFSGGLVGFFSYDIVRFFENLPSSLPNTLECPDAHFIIPAYLLCFDHLKQEVILVSYKKEEDEIEEIVGRGDGSEVDEFSVSSLHAEIGQEEFEDGVVKAKEYIREG